MDTLKKGTDFIGVAVVYFCHDGKGNVVMAQRSQNARDEKGRWDIGGGAVEFGDPIEECLKKEIKEEYCTDIKAYEFLGIRDVHREHDGKKTHWIALDYKVLVDRDMVAIGEPHKFDNIGWFTLKKIPKEIHSQLPTFLEKYKKEL
ncbi:NUDIX domain-containing protein [Candidatus Parcubacteria bacterium]|nr:NUDIX domain-containing protein [Candidatus Parcubacteria bacterium]